MRSVALACALCMATPGLRAQVTPPESPAPAPSVPLWLGDPDVDVAKVRDRLRERQAGRLRWEQATTLGDYERCGQKDPRWDAEARAALAKYAESLVPGPGVAGRTAAAKAACQRALDAGCQDPLLVYARLRLEHEPYQDVKGGRSDY